MLAHCPEIAPAKQRVEKMVLNVDIAPTILDAAGVPIPNTMDGSSFLPLLRGENVPWRQSFLYEYFWEQMFPQTPTVFGVRTETHKYMWYHGIWDKNEVYDLKDDPHEMTNLIDDPASSALRKELESELARLMNELSVSRVPSWSRQSL
jgi:N-acetylglucosamine-6-sulfatase